MDDHAINPKPKKPIICQMSGCAEYGEWDLTIIESKNGEDYQNWICLCPIHWRDWDK